MQFRELGLVLNHCKMGWKREEMREEIRFM
jgi:hypothetical protein